MSELEIPVSPTSNYGVVVGNGTTIRGKGVCKAVMVILPEVTVTKNFLPLELRTVDVNLGMQRLCSMGYMGVHWPGLTMTPLE